MIKEIKFEVGRLYYDKWGNLKKCTKRTEQSVWLNGVRYNITSYPSQYNNYTEATNYNSADNYDDVEIQKKRALQELLVCVEKVCGCDSNVYAAEKELEIYDLCLDLKGHLKDYLSQRSI